MTDRVQKFILETDSRELLIRYLKEAIPSILNSTEQIAIKVVDHDDPYKTLYYPSCIYNEKGILPILLIGGWYKPEDKKDNTYFNGYKPWTLFDGKRNLPSKAIKHILHILDTNQAELEKRFLKESGDGYNSGFNMYDGSVGIGYRLMSNDTFPSTLSMSLVHIYYGK